MASESCSSMTYISSADGIRGWPKTLGIIYAVKDDNFTVSPYERKINYIIERAPFYMKELIIFKRINSRRIDRSITYKTKVGEMEHYEIQ